MWCLTFVVAVLFVIGTTCSPMDLQSEHPSATELPQIESNTSTEIDPAIPFGIPASVRGKNLTTVFLINIYAIKNKTADQPDDALQSDVIEEVSEKSQEPLATFVLLVEDGDVNATRPVDLDDVAKDLESEGFATQKIVKKGVTSIVKVDLSKIQPKFKATLDKSNMTSAKKGVNGRRKRSPWGGGGGGGGGGCGGGCQQQQTTYTTYTVYVVPVKMQRPRMQRMRKQQCGCNPCG